MAGRTGVWLVGARGSVATTVVAGAAALRAGLVPPTGCVTELPPFWAAGLPTFGDLVFGGHDVTDTPLPIRAEMLAAAGVVPAALLPLAGPGLEAAEAEIRPGIGAPAMLDERSDAETASRIAADIVAFRERQRLERVVVVNVASTEAPFAGTPATASIAALERALPEGRGVLPPSSLYAYAAFRAGCPFVDFTPSAGARLPALGELAIALGLPYAGSDGKTGETLMKAALAPMFATRALRVRSWSGTNLLGGGDGANLADPGAAASKTASKRQALTEALGYGVDGAIHIDYVPDLGDWKTAWDHITFEGFLGVRMTLQFTWQGCDSALAAPLVLDLARLVARAHEAGEAGPLGALGVLLQGSDRDLGAGARGAVCPADRLGGRPRRDTVRVRSRTHARAPRRPAADRGRARTRRTGRPVTGAAIGSGPRLADLAELVRAPAALTVPGDTLAGAAAAGWPFGAALSDLGSRRRASTGPAWRSTTMPTGTSMRWSGRTGRSRRVASRPTRRSASPRRSRWRGSSLAAVFGGRPALAVAVPLAACVWAYDLALKATPAGPVGDGRLPRVSTSCSARGRRGWPPPRRPPR